MPAKAALWFLSRWLTRMAGLAFGYGRSKTLLTRMALSSSSIDPATVSTLWVSAVVP
jgi:hypothetical protein